MLERAAGCLENAGRRFFRDSSGAIRRSRPLYSHFTQHTGASADLPHWLLAFVQASDLRTPHGPSATSNADSTTSDTRSPFLEFLYPLHTRPLAASCLSHSTRRLVSRRRKKNAPGLPRTYSSKAASHHQGSLVDDAVFDVDGTTHGNQERRRAKDNLLALLGQKGSTSYEEAWTHYVAAGRPSDLNSALVAHLSHSSNDLDHMRTRNIFDAIPHGCRSANDYLYLTKSYVAAKKSKHLKEICIEAALEGEGAPCLAFAIAVYVSQAQWTAALEMWHLRPRSPEDGISTDSKWLHSIVPQVSMVSFLRGVPALPNQLRRQEIGDLAGELVRVLKDHAFSSLKVIEDTPTEVIINTLREFKRLGILTAEDFLKLIETAQSSGLRATFVRSVVIYRSFRWHMEKEVPPEKLLVAMLRSLASFEITNGVLYFMEEYARFHGKPSPTAYNSALIAFSRTGDVSQVHNMFARLVSDHGKPRSRKMLSPLLYVHARVGNVQETRRHFNRIPEEFGLELNTVCWNILLTAHANAGDLSGCFRTFEQMLKSGVELNSHTFGILMGLCANRGDVTNVRRLLSVAKQRQIRITAPLLDTFVEAYCRNGKFDIAESIVETCLGLSITGSRVRMWNLLLWHHAFRIDLESISRLRSRMDAKNLQPDGMTYAALMLSLVLVGQTHAARRVFRTLHRNKRVHASEFHYTIIMYGYIRERNRDMVHIVFREIQERFSHPGSSSRLLFLKSQVQRDLQLIRSGGEPMESANIRLGNAEKFLAETIADFDTTKLASKEPMPATGRQSAIEAFPAMFYEYIMNAYGARGAFEKVQELFDQFTSRQQPLGYSENVHDIAPLRLLNTLMLTHLRADQHAQVEECWQMAFPRAVKLAAPLNISEWLSAQLPLADNLDPFHPSLSPSGTTDTSEALPSNEPKILPSFRFLLSRPLSLYMRSLAYRNEIGRISQVVAAVEHAGFCLTTFNWSTYVQMLSSSDKPSDQMEAFTIFEQKFMPQFPGWTRLRRGLGVKPAEAPVTIGAIEDKGGNRRDKYLGRKGRRLWSKIQPDFMQPTYVTMVYLASALLSFRERSILKGNFELMAVYSAAPGTVEALGHMPYMREKFQGVLLRSRQQQGDMRRGVSEDEPYVWTGGVLGVGGRSRTPSDLQMAFDGASIDADNEPALAQLVTDIKSQAANTPIESPQDSPVQKALDPEDEHDIETETNLEATIGQPDPDDESRHIEHLDNLSRSLQQTLEAKNNPPEDASHQHDAAEEVDDETETERPDEPTS